MTKNHMREAIAASVGTQEKLLICCAGEEAERIYALVQQLGGMSVSWEPDLRWQNLIRLALLNRVTVAIGQWRQILGLAKLAKATAAPLRIRRVVLTGEACPQWALDAIRGGLDATVCDGTCPNMVLEDTFLQALDQSLLRWSSVLDYRAKQTEMGLSMELVVFPGKQLPQLPSGAKVTFRSWEPGTDMPFCL